MLSKTAARDWCFDTFAVSPSDVPLPACPAVRAMWQRGCHGGLLRQGLPGQLPLWLRPGRTGGVPGRPEGLLLSASGKHQQRGTAHSPLPALCPPLHSECIIVGSPRFVFTCVVFTGPAVWAFVSLMCFYLWCNFIVCKSIHFSVSKQNKWGKK